MKETGKVYFEERQKFQQKWLWILLISANIFTAGLLFKSVRNDEVNDHLLISLALVAGLTVLFLFLRLDTQLTSEGIKWRWGPFQKSFRLIKWEETNEIYLRRYHPIREFGGWGIRFGFKGRAYNISGNQGIQIVYKNGSRLLIGTQKPEHMKKALKIISEQPVHSIRLD